MTPEQREAWLKEYDSISIAYRASPPEGEALALYKLNRYLTDYLRTIESVDRNTGRLLDYLKEAGLLENTLVVYTSDQGFLSWRARSGLTKDSCTRSHSGHR